jgi:hypothetical protein
MIPTRFWCPVRNAASTAVPPYGLMRITGVGDDGIATVDQPNANSQQGLFVNGPVAIPVATVGNDDTGKGQGHFTWPAPISYQIDASNEAAPANGDIMGSESGSWHLHADQTGFIVLGGAGTTMLGMTVVNAMPHVSAGGGVPNAQVGTTYTVLSSDNGSPITFTNTNPIAVTLPQATGSFGPGFMIPVLNLGAGVATFTPGGGSLINGFASITLSQYEGGFIYSNGTDYIFVKSSPAPTTPGTALSTVTVALKWYKYTKTFADFSTAGNTNEITLDTMVAGAVIHAVKVKHSDNFAGGAIASYTINVGITSMTPAFMTSAFNVFQAESATALTVSSINQPYGGQVGLVVRALATSTGAFLNAATQGSVDIWLLASLAT